MLFCLALQFYTVFYNPQNIYHKNAKSHESMKILTLKILAPHKERSILYWLPVSGIIIKYVL